MLVRGIEAAGYTPGEQIAIALDPATTEIYENGRYVLEHENRTLTADEMAAYWAELAGRYPIVSIEDGMDEDDWDGWTTLTERARRQGPARRRRPLRHQQSQRLQTRHRRRRRQLDPHQGQPDRHADRDARRDRAGARERLHRRDVAPLGRDRGRHDRRPRRRHRLRPDQDRRPARSTGVAKYNQLLRIEEALGTDAVPRGARRATSCAELGGMRQALVVRARTWRAWAAGET